MSDPTNQPGEDSTTRDDDIDLPIVDYLYLDAGQDAFVVTFVPTDSASLGEKEVAVLDRAGAAGQSVADGLRQIGSLLGGSDIDRVYHGGGSQFGFYFGDGTAYRLTRDALPADVRRSVLHCLRDIALATEAAFCAAHPPTARSV